MDPNHPLDLFRGRDHEGNYIFSFTGRFPRLDALALPKLAILDITLTYRNDGLSEFAIRLLDRSQVDIFRALCADLLAATEGLVAKTTGLAYISSWHACADGESCCAIVTTGG